jgi:hypothetical protein
MPTVDRTRSAPPPIPSRMWRSLIGTGDAGVQSLQSRTVKDELRSLLALAGTNPERHILRTQEPLKGRGLPTRRCHTLRHTGWQATSRHGDRRSKRASRTGYLNARSEGYSHHSRASAVSPKPGRV